MVQRRRLFCTHSGRTQKKNGSLCALFTTQHWYQVRNMYAVFCKGKNFKLMQVKSVRFINQFPTVFMHVWWCEQAHCDCKGEQKYNIYNYFLIHFLALCNGFAPNIPDPPLLGFSTIAFGSPSLLNAPIVATCCRGTHTGSLPSHEVCAIDTHTVQPHPRSPWSMRGGLKGEASHRVFFFIPMHRMH